MANHSKLIIRPAGEPDLEALCALYFEFHEFHARNLPTFLQSLGRPTEDECTELRQEILKIMSNGDAALLVAEEAGQVIGLAEIYRRYPDRKERAISSTPYAHLQSLAVAKSFRRKGIGTHLIHVAEAWAREHGALELRLDIWEFSASPLRFYQKTGYRTYRRSLVKNL